MVFIGDYHSRPGNAKVKFIHTKIEFPLVPDIQIFWKQKEEDIHSAMVQTMSINQLDWSVFSGY